jgi:hypothetical protein
MTSNKTISTNANINKALRNATRHLKPGTNTSRKKQQQQQQGRYADDAAYQRSFTKMDKFQKQFKEQEKREYNYIIYHKDNDDGYVAAYLYWKFITNDGKDRSRSDVVIDAMPGRNFSGSTVVNSVQRQLSRYAGKNILLVDIGFNSATLKAISQVANKLLVIDDHPDITRNKNRNSVSNMTVFVDKDHCAAASLFKFLHPLKPVPILVQYIDNSDSKLFMSHLPFHHFFKIAFSILYTKNQKFKNKLNLMYDGVFEKLNEVFDDGNNMTLIFIGKYMNDARENLKEDVAAQAVPAKFFGYNVGILNYDSPGLSKPVGRQIISNMRAKGIPIDFSLLWVYHHSTNRYRIQIMDDHVQTKLSMPKLAMEFAQKLGYGTGEAGGHGHIGNFYLEDKGPNGKGLLPLVLRKGFQ